MWRYFISKEFIFTILGLMLGGALVFVLLFQVFLPWYTRHGERVEVPRLTEMNLEEATKKLESLGLNPVVAESLYIAGLETLQIISQDPVGNSMVKPDRQVYLTVNKVVPPMVEVPDIIGVSNYQAKLRLEGANLNIAKIEFVPHQYKNLVVSATHNGKRVKEGDQLPKYSELVLTVGRGQGSQKVEIPELVGKHYQSAMSILHRNGLNIGAIRFKPDAPDEKGTVIQQNPRYIPGDSTYLGSEVSLIIAGPEPEEAIEDMRYNVQEGSGLDSLAGDSLD